MSEVPLINWLNTDVKLSKQITSIPEDFQNGYYFAEILHIFGLIPNFSSYTNSTKKKDISKNYQYLTKAFVDLNIKFNDDKRNQVLNKQKGIAAQLLFQIKQALDRRYISKETLMPKRSRELADIYNANLFKNDNEKYFRDLLNKQAVTGKKKLTPLQKFSQTLSDYDKEILNNIEKDEAYLKKEHDDRLNSIHKKEKEKGQLEKDKDEKNLQSWNNQMTIKRKFDKQMHDEFWSQVEFYKAEVLKAFQNSQQEQVNSVINFNNTLSRLRLDRVDDGMARTLINKDAVMKQGYFCKIKGLVNPLEKSGVAVDGEALEAVALVDEANALFAIVAGDGHRYESATDYNFGDIADTKAGEAVRGYILHKGDVVTVESVMIDGVGSVNAGDKLAVKAGGYTLAKAAGTEKAVVAMVLKKGIKIKHITIL